MDPEIVSRAEWLAARKQLLIKEKELTRRNDELSRERQRLPWVRVDVPYAFSGPNGALGLRELFGSCSQLVVYHFMLGPGRREGCPSCSFVVDHLEASLVHLAARDVALALISRAPYAEIAAFQRRMGWRISWVSSHGSDFNRDFHASFGYQDLASGTIDYNYAEQPVSVPADGDAFQEAHGVSVFARRDAEVFHTYSAYARGVERLVGTYQLLDLVPKGRSEAGLPWPMAWVRHHDRYDAELSHR